MVAARSAGSTLRFRASDLPVGDKPPFPEERKEPPAPVPRPVEEPPPPHEPEDPPPDQQPPAGDPLPSQSPIGDPPRDGTAQFGAARR